MIEKGSKYWTDGFFSACFRGHLNIVKLMMKNGAKNWLGGLMYACVGQHFDVAKFLLHHYFHSDDNDVLENHNFYEPTGFQMGIYGCYILFNELGDYKDDNFQDLFQRTSVRFSFSKEHIVLFAKSLSLSELIHCKTLTFLPSAFQNMIQNELYKHVLFQSSVSFDENLFPVLRRYI